MDQKWPLSELISEVAKNYPLVQEEIPIHSTSIKIVKPKSMDDLLNEYEKNFDQDERLPYWAHLWESAIVLSEIIFSEYDFKNEKVLELGSGLGLAGIVAGLKNGRVIYSDYDEKSFEFIRINHHLNFNEEPEMMYLDWRYPDVKQKFKWIIASDIVYEPNMYKTIIKLFKKIIHPRGKILLTEPSRKFAIQFFELLKVNGFQYSMKEITYKDKTDQQLNIKFYEISYLNSGKSL